MMGMAPVLIFVALHQALAFAVALFILKRYADRQKKRYQELEQTFEKKINEFSYVNGLLAKLSSIKQLDEMLKVFGHEIKELISVSSILIFVKKDNSNDYLCHSAVGKSANAFKDFKLNGFQELAVSELDELKKPIILSHSELKVLLPSVSNKMKLKNTLLIPLLIAGDLNGFICCCNKSTAFNVEDLQTMEVIGRQIAVLLEKSSLFEKMEAKRIDLEKFNEWFKKSRKAFVNILEDINYANAELEKSLQQSLSMYNIAVELSKSLDESRLLEKILSNSADLVNAKGGSLILKNGPRLHQAANFNYTSDLHLNLAHSPINWVIDNQKPLIINNFKNTQYREYRRLSKIDNFIGVPLVQNDKCLGVLCLFSKDGGFTRQDNQGLVTLAHQATVTLLNARVHENEKRTVTKLKEIDKMKADFVASVSHELRSPLTTLKGYLELIADEEAGPLTDEQVDFIKIINQSSDRLLDLISDLLTISKIESATLKMNKEQLSINDVLEEVVKDMVLEAKQKRIKISLDLTRDLPFVNADQERLDQVVINLLTNAIKFTPEGGSIQITSQLHGNGLEVSVKDSGIGIADSDKKRLFDKFYRSGQAISRNIKGTGLGLAIAKGIIDQHQGKIWVESEVGKGSTFYFSLPIKTRTAA